MSDVFVFLAAYANGEDAHADYDVVRELHGAGRLGAWDAAVLARDAFGQVHIEKDVLPTGHGAWPGTAVGALAGLLVPPTLLVSGPDGTGAGELAGRFRHGLADVDLGELGDVLDIAQAALVVVADSKVADRLDERLTDAIATIEKTLPANDDLVQALRSSGAGEEASPKGKPHSRRTTRRQP
jgi:uncharacterized membrane protein